MYLLLIFVLQVLVYALLGQQKKKGSSEGEVRAFTIYLAQCTRNTKLILKIQVPGCSLPPPPESLLPQVYK